MINPLKLFKILEQIADLLKKIVEGRDDLKEKYENEGIKGKLIVEDCEILFLARRLK
jgi:hypothetical protein